MDGIILQSSGRDMINDAKMVLLEKHYLKRIPSITHAFVYWINGVSACVGTFGVPSSREVQKSACHTNPDNVLEFNRLWVDDRMLRNTESWFIGQMLRRLPPLIIVSYADTSKGHEGYVYRASNFYYAGYTDMERKTPRYDYVPLDGTHSRNAFRQGYSHKEIRKPKQKYWTITGNKRDKKELSKIATWPKLDWKEVFIPEDRR